MKTTAIRSGPPQLMSQRHPGRDRHDSPLNAVAEDAPGAEVLAAAASAADARLLAHDLGDQALDVPGVRQEVAVAAVAGEDDISIHHRFSDRDPRPFLADAGVDRAEKFPLREEV